MRYEDSNLNSVTVMRYKVEKVCKLRECESLNLIQLKHANS